MYPLSQLNWGFLEILYLIIIFLVGFFVTYITLPYLIKYMKKKEYIGFDIHKNARPRVAESGGLVIIIGFIVASMFLMIFFPIFLN